jgi:cell wall-associated NlpC family hydrolase
MITQPRPGPTLLICLITGAYGCAWEPSSVDADAPAAAVEEADTASRAAQFALWQEGVPYRYGGASPDGFDCSGLVYYAYGLAGKDVPRTTADLHRHATPLKRSALEAGDLVFFNIDGKVSHVGIYLERGRFVHAPRTGRTVSVESLDSAFYQRTFLGGGRLP